MHSPASKRSKTLVSFLFSLANLLSFCAEYSKYFTVETLESSRDYTLLQLDKFRFLYCLFMVKFGGKATEQSFYEYIDKFLAEGTSWVHQVGLWSAMVLDLISPERLEAALKYFLEKLEDSPAKV